MENKVVEGYKIEKCVGKGNFGQVWKASKEGRNYALKILPEDNETCVIEKDIATNTRFKSKFLINYCNVFKHEGRQFIVMELCEGGDLYSCIERWIEDEVLPNNQRVMKIMIQVALGLEELHQNKMVHRDIKPQNIFINNKSEVKIGDFGLVKKLNSSSEGTSTRAGTPSYMAPEIHDEKTYNSKADVWSLGVLLYQVCALKLPFHHQGKYQIGTVVLAGKYDPLPSHVDEEIAKIIYAMLTQDPARRPSIRDLLLLPVTQTYAERLGLIKDFPIYAVLQSQRLPAASSSTTVCPSVGAAVALLAYPTKDCHYGGAVRGVVSIPHGKGMCHYGSELKGEVYVGDWVDGKKEGMGTYIWPSGQKYEGCWVNDVREGQGVMTYADNADPSVLKILVGDVLTTVKECAVRYEGSWRDGKRHGHGVQSYVGGHVYTGNWVNDEREGDGEMEYGMDSPFNLRSYKGQWKRGWFEGRGVTEWKGGSRYDGEYQGHNKHGNGKITWGSGETYAGEWANDRRNGEGTMTWPNGEKYVGGWVNGMKNGQGLLTDGKGVLLHEGLWKDDKQVRKRGWF